MLTDLVLMRFSGYSLLHYCSIYNFKDLVETLLQRGAMDINLKTHKGATALHLAAGAGNMDIVTMLVSFGADVLCVDEDSLTPIQTAFMVYCLHFELGMRALI